MQKAIPFSPKATGIRTSSLAPIYLDGIAHWCPAAAKLLQSCLTLCDPRDGSPPGSPIPGILQVRTLERGAISFSNWCPAAAAAAAKLLQSCPTLCDPIDSSPPGSPVPGILQARTLEWVAISFSNWCPNRCYFLGLGSESGTSRERRFLKVS